MSVYIAHRRPMSNLAVQFDGKNAKDVCSFLIEYYNVFANVRNGGRYIDFEEANNTSLDTAPTRIVKGDVVVIEYVDRPNSPNSAFFIYSQEEFDYFFEREDYFEKKDD